MKQSGGTVKKIAGQALDDPRLALEGRIQEATGRAQKNYGDIRNDPETLK